MAGPSTVELFATVGLGIITWTILDALWELMIGVKAHILPRIKSNKIDLIDKFGTWAGKYYFIVIYFFFDFIFLSFIF